MKKQLSSLSIFFPVLNDSKILPTLLRKAHQVAAQITHDFELIVINDGSTDDTFNVLENLKKLYPQLKVVHHRKNLGYGKALISGFKHATKSWVFYTDGDGQYDPGEIDLLLKAKTEEVDVVNGCKIKRSDNFLRSFLGSSYNFILHKIYSLPITDVDCDFRLIRRSLLKRIQLSCSSGTICLELLIKLKQAGAKFNEVNVHHYPRPFGRSQFFRPQRIFKLLCENISFYRKYRKIDKPCEIWENG